MKEVNETYYLSNNGKKFATKEECLNYEDSFNKETELREKIKKLTKELAIVVYKRDIKDSYIKRAESAGGNGHEGFYNKCPHCGKITGGYEKQNLTIEVDSNVYQCENCEGYFTYN